MPECLELPFNFGNPVPCLLHVPRQQCGMWSEKKKQTKFVHNGKTVRARSAQSNIIIHIYDVHARACYEHVTHV